MKNKSSLENMKSVKISKTFLADARRIPVRKGTHKGKKTKFITGGGF